MNSGPIDISSDEESFHRNEKEDDDEYDWVSELLDSVDNKNDDDSDEVLVIGEVNTKPKSKSSRRTVTYVDDDCVILDGDPDKPVSVVDDSDSGSDELLVVGEKGPVACRDYPHPRHLCAKFPFSTTLHVRHCDLCHCFVCDSLAPCVHWGTGVSNIDHCHATDKEETWKILRRNFKLGKTTPLPASKLSVALPEHTNASPLNIIRLTPNSVAQIQVSRSSTIRACSSVGHTVPSIGNPGRSHKQEFPLSKSRIQPCSVSKQILGVRNNAVRRNRVHNMGNLAPQLVSHHSVFKRLGAVGGSLPMNQTALGSSNSSSCTSPSQYCGNYTPMAASNGGNPLRWQNVHSSLPQNASQPMDMFFGHKVPSQPQTCSSAMAPNFQSVYSQNFPQEGNQSENGNQSISQYGNQSQDASQDAYHQYGNQSLNSSQDGVHGNLGASVTDMGFSDCNYGWANNSSQIFQQPPYQPPPILQPLPHLPQPPVENSLIQSKEPIHGPTPVKEQSNGIANLGSLDMEFENWLLENQSAPTVSNDSVPSPLTIMSPEPTFIDTGMLMFDFETSWNGLTQV